MDKATTAGETYCVNVLTPPVSVYAILPNTDPEQRELIKTLDKAGQGYFTAQSGKVVFEGGQVGLVTQVFNPAPAADGDGGSLSPAEKSAVSSLASGSINYDGAFAVHAQQLWLYGASIDTMGGNVYHRTGSATFTGANTTAVMSGTGFIVYNGTASVTSPVIFRVSADASVDPFISLADAQGNEKIRIEADANDPYIKIDSARVLTADDVAQTYDPAGTAPLSGAAVQQAITGGSTADDVRIFDAALPTMWETLMAGLATPRQLVESAIALQVAGTGAELNTLTPHKTDGDAYFLQTGAFSVNSVVGVGTSPNIFALPTNVATCVVSGTAGAPNPNTRITLGVGGTTDYFIYFPNDRTSVSAALSCCSAVPNSTSSPSCKSITLYAPKGGANPNGRFELLASTDNGSNWNMNGAVVTLWLPVWNKYNRYGSSGVPLLRDAVGSFDAFVYMPRMDTTPFYIATKAKLTEASMLFILRTYGALVEHAAAITLNIGCDAALQDPNAAEGDAPFLSEALNTAWNECAARNVSVAVIFNE